MDRVIITNPMIGLVAMQACVVKDATDEEILRVCNLKNPSGTTLGWNKVIRTMEDTEYKEALPVQCEDYPGREHLLITC